MKHEKPPIYDEKGRVKNPDIAQKMAGVEDSYHKKILGVFKPSKGKIERGERDAEGQIE